jgi:hypothetical protein
MSRLRIPVLMLCLLASCAEKETGEKAPSRPTNAEKEQDVHTVRNGLLAWQGAGPLCGNDLDEHDRQLELSRQALCKELGERRVLAACETVVARPESDGELRAAFLFLARMKGDRHRFVEPAVAALKHADAGVRIGAATLLGEIGSRNEAAALVAALSDGDATLPAAEALAAVGGPNEVTAMDAWLAGPGRDRLDVYRDGVKEGRDALAARLAREREKEKR